MLGEIDFRYQKQPWPTAGKRLLARCEQLGCWHHRTCGLQLHETSDAKAQKENATKHLRDKQAVLSITLPGDHTHKMT